MLKIGVTENCIVKSFAQYSATTLQNITKYFFNKRLKINDNIFVIALKKYEDKIVAEELREMLMADNQGAVFKKIF
jgi:hypothetical protein